MRIINGVEQGRQLLTRTIHQEPEIPEAVLRRVAQIFNEEISPEIAVQRILTDVRQHGDRSVRDYAYRIDGIKLDQIEISRQKIVEAIDLIPSEIADALKAAAHRIRSFTRASMPQNWSDEDLGVGERIIPLQSVGLYVPGGTAAYPSTVLMNAITAKVAGVSEVILCTPTPNLVVLSAAYIAGVDRVFSIGGAQAIGAMAYGTDTVPNVHKICGPGNIFVSIAKRLVYGTVDIDGLYGPTETMVIADNSANPVLCAADLLAQAEHDSMASPILVTTSSTIADRTMAELNSQILSLPRKSIASESIGNQGLIVVVSSLDDMFELVNAYAPEHVCLLIKNSQKYIDKIRNAGAVFLGDYSPEVIGDYVAGPSHTMPTGGTARYASYLGVNHFLRRMPVVNLELNAFLKLGPIASILAKTEKLNAHSAAIDKRLEGEIGQNLQKTKDANG